MKILIAALFSVALIGLNAGGSTPALTNVEHVKATAAVRPLEVKPAQPQATEAKAPQPAQPQPDQQPVPDLNNHEQLMQLAGISSNDWPAVDYIVSHESAWNPDATEPTTGAHGLPQALPYGKTGCGWEDAVCQLAWADGYAKTHCTADGICYNGWWGAYNYWVIHRNW